MDPKNVHVLIPGTCKYVSLNGKRNFADVINILRWGHSLNGHNVIMTVLTGRRQVGQSVRWRCDESHRGENDVQPRSKEWGQSLEAEKNKEMDSPRSLQRENSPAFFSSLLILKL